MSIAQSLMMSVQSFVSFWWKAYSDVVRAVSEPVPEISTSHVFQVNISIDDSTVFSPSRMIFTVLPKSRLFRLMNDPAKPSNLTFLTVMTAFFESHDMMPPPTSMVLSEP